MGRYWNITPKQAQTFVAELIEQLEDYDFGLPGLFTITGTTVPRYPKSWPKFFRGIADALEEENARTHKRRNKTL